MKNIFKSYFYLMLLAVLLTLTPASARAQAGAADSVLNSVSPDISAALYLSEVRDFQNYDKWRMFYNYLFSPEYGGLYLTKHGNAALERLERTIKMPVKEAFSLFGGEALMWVDIDEFNDKNVNAAAVFKCGSAGKWKSIINDNFINGSEDSRVEKLPAEEFAYYINFKILNVIAGENRPKYIEGSFGVAITGETVVLAYPRDYFVKTLDNMRESVRKTPEFVKKFDALRSKRLHGFFIDWERIYSISIKSLAGNIKKLENNGAAKVDEKKQKTNSKDMAASLQMIMIALESSGLGGIKNLAGDCEMMDEGAKISASLSFSKDEKALKFAGGEFDYAALAGLCPADVSNFVAISIDYAAIIDCVDKIFEKMPLTARTQYFLAKSALVAASGMRLREDIAAMLSNELIIMNKVTKSKTLGLWVAEPTVLLKLKDSKTAEKLIGKFVEQKKAAKFEIKEYMGVKYFYNEFFSGVENQSVCIALCGDYFIVSLNFNNFTSVIRNLKKPENVLADLPRFKNAVKNLKPRAFYFVYSNDEELSQYYMDINYAGGDSDAANNELMARYDRSKIDWRKIKESQAPSTAIIYRGENSFELIAIGGFKRSK